MKRSRLRLSRSIAAATLLAGTLVALGVAIGERHPAERPPRSISSPVEVAPAPARLPAVGAVATVPVKPPLPSVEPTTEFPSVAARTAAAALLAEAADARKQGDLRTTLRLLQTAVERAPTVETHAALGALYLELGGRGRGGHSPACRGGGRSRRPPTVGSRSPTRSP